jgi:aminoglycoside phosphotransferase family enzyme/predicted kinase
MELARMLEALSRPAAYPYPVEAVEVRQTHISAVFLAGPFVYKVKKPVVLPFLDFGTLERRRHFCEEEVRLNRRLAPDVYQGVVPVTAAPGGPRVEGEGEPIEWAVKMRRLPEEATLLERLQKGEVGAGLVEALGRRVAAFHRASEANERTEARGRFETVARTIRDVFAQAAPKLGTTVSQEVLGRVRALADSALEQHRPLIEARPARDCHGDLRLDHVYHFPDRDPPADLVVIDCIEFNERLRFIDPVADMAFLAMDLAFRGRSDLAGAFADAYFRESGDGEGRLLLPLYTAYRSCVRGEVEGLLLAEAEVPQAERDRALGRARAYWLLALAELEAPSRKPCLLLVGGLPGSGKSTLARGVAGAAGFSVIRSDVVRKELAGPPGQAPPREALYGPGWDDRTYAECLRRAEGLLFAGGRALVDATFREERRRRDFLGAAARWGVPAAMLHCHAGDEAVRGRLEGRRGDASDADWAVYRQLAAGWEEPGEPTRRHYHPLSTEGNPEQALALALAVLRRLGLQG